MCATSTSRDVMPPAMLVIEEWRRHGDPVALLRKISAAGTLVSRAAPGRPRRVLGRDGLGARSSRRPGKSRWILRKFVEDNSIDNLKSIDTIQTVCLSVVVKSGVGRLMDIEPATEGELSILEVIW
jgi:hypothetical protein